MFKNFRVLSYYFFCSKCEVFITPPDPQPPPHAVLVVSTSITLDTLFRTLFAGFMKKQSGDSLSIIFTCTNSQKL